MKKLMILALCVVIALCVVTLLTPTVQASASGITGSCTWSLEGTVLTISGSGQMGSYDVLPGAGHSNAPWGHEITHIVIENGVTNIGRYAFYGYRRLQSVSIPGSVMQIDTQAFDRSSITSITLPEGLTTICDGAFNSCYSLSQVTLPSTITRISDYAFQSCPITDIVFPVGLEYIGYSAFNYVRITDVWYLGTQNDKAGMTIEGYNACLNTAVWHYESCPVGAPHAYENTCDDDCNNCGATREITHLWNAIHSYDDVQHWTECSVCGEIKEQERHTGGTSSCIEKASCVVCLQPYGELADCFPILEIMNDQYLKTSADCCNAAVYYKSCGTCGKSKSDTFTGGVKDPNNHTGETEIRNSVSAKCSDDGYSGDTYCKECNEKIASGIVISASHKLNKVNAKTATHNAAGNIEHYVCSECGKLFDYDDATIELTGTDVVVPKLDHTYGEWMTIKKAEVGVEGSEERICTVCGYKQTMTVQSLSNPATGDNSHIGVLLTMMLVSALGLCIVLPLSIPKINKQNR